MNFLLEKRRTLISISAEWRRRRIIMIDVLESDLSKLTSPVKNGDTAPSAESRIIDIHTYGALRSQPI